MGDFLASLKKEVEKRGRIKNNSSRQVSKIFSCVKTFLDFLREEKKLALMDEYFFDVDQKSLLEEYFSLLTKSKRSYSTKSLYCYAMQKLFSYAATQKSVAKYKERVDVARSLEALCSSQLISYNKKSRLQKASGETQEEEEEGNRIESEFFVRYIAVYFFFHSSLRYFQKKKDENLLNKKKMREELKTFCTFTPEFLEWRRQCKKKSSRVETNVATEFNLIRMFLIFLRKEKNFEKLDETFFDGDVGSYVQEYLRSFEGQEGASTILNKILALATFFKFGVEVHAPVSENEKRSAAARSAESMCRQESKKWGKKKKEKGGKRRKGGENVNEDTDNNNQYVPRKRRTRGKKEDEVKKKGKNVKRK